MLIAICSKITSGIALNCAVPLQAGTRDELYLFNYDDFQDATISRNSSNTQIIEDIIMSSGATGFVFEGVNNSIMPKNSMKKGKFLNAFTHDINFKAFDLNPSVKQQLELMSKGRFVAIVQNNYKGTGGNAAYEIYGLDSGLIVSVLDRDPNNQDTQGGYDITLQSSDVSLEAHLPATIFITDYATTKLLVEGLL